MYNLKAYEMIQNGGLGLTIQHDKDVHSLSQSRGYEVFRNLKAELGPDTLQFKATGQTQQLDIIMKFLYLYLFKYNKDQLKFMNECAFAEMD